MTSLSGLAASWQQRVADPFVPFEVKRAVRACAAELEAAIVDARSELLSQTAAARELGVTTSTIRRWEREDRLVRAQPDRAVYRRSDLLAAARGEAPAKMLELIDARA